MNHQSSFIIKKSMKKRNILLVLFATIILFAVIYDINTAYTGENTIVEGLSNSLIRFHVIANSDSIEDQALKVKVKDKVIDLMQDLLKDSKTIDESRNIIVQNMETIKSLAQKTIFENGVNDRVNIELTKQDFPLKQYGDVVLPPGEYEALVIKIGKAEGKNWWCVLFPPLCFVDATHGVIDENSKQGLKNVLTEEEYSSIILSKDTEVNIKVKSKLVKWFADKENKLLKETMLAEKR